MDLNLGYRQCERNISARKQTILININNIISGLVQIIAISINERKFKNQNDKVAKRNKAKEKLNYIEKNNKYLLNYCETYFPLGKTTYRNFNPSLLMNSVRESTNKQPPTRIQVLLHQTVNGCGIA